MATLSSGSVLLGDFPPLSSFGRLSPRTSSSSVAALGLPRVLVGSDRNVAFELLVEDLRKIHPHLQFETSDDSIVRQIKTLTAENLVLRKQAEAMNVNPSPPKWSDVVNQGCDNSRMKPFYQPPIIREARVVVCPPEGIIEEGISRWSGCVVGYFLDKGLPYTSVRNIATTIWKKYGKLLVLKKWSPQMTLVKEQLTRIPIWVHLNNVPLELWSAAGLSFIASPIGIPLYADRFTETVQRLSYARICVKVEVGAKFVDSIDVMYTDGTKVTVGVKYPWRPARCLDCHVFGHSTQQCGKKVGVTKTAWVAKEVGRKSKVAAVPEVTSVLEGVSTGGLDFALIPPGIVGRVGLDVSRECGPSTQPVGSLGMGDTSFQTVLVDSSATSSLLARNKSV
ncbi:hypothetical protein RHGRI_032471 [Rhododendron griersonianum]|uniref:DUF4283 domain-containing protein n=1 Tax=Rhododendron griersonianum TaxID=479676 RepID=A0AAV6IEE9_9ERIC|nr:hypothetical protein RHGRI_032471 [Rhododendron griersonianum]